ncbi:hypothetical protein [Shewanella donghaensis]|uniref:hypothetical protein n=1 Tax=Shewanella donghaensis TaxID=238836 RepID=UPI0011837B36|nr:hypothetical protein [Shewanella donghaensis]
MNKGTCTNIESLFEIETSDINTYTQEVDITFIYDEISTIHKQVEKLKQIANSPFEVFSANPYEEDEKFDFSYLQKVVRQSLVVKSTADIHKNLSEMVSQANSNDTSASLEKYQVILMYNLMLFYKMIGEYNQFIQNYSYIRRTKIADAKASFDEYEKFETEYSVAMEFAYDVFNHFYTQAQNRFYKMNTLINTIEEYCINQRVPFPKSRKSKAYAHFYFSISDIATKEARSPGRSLKEYSVIDSKDFAKNYGSLLVKN